LPFSYCEIKKKQNKIKIDKKEKHKIRVFSLGKKEKISKNYHRKIKIITILPHRRRVLLEYSSYLTEFSIRYFSKHFQGYFKM